MDTVAFQGFPSARRTQLDFVPQDGAAFVAVWIPLRDRPRSERCSGSSEA